MKLTKTSYAVLAQVAVRPWSTYELARQRVRYFRYVWPRAESAIYREAKRLAAMGLIAGAKEYTGKRARTIYSITDDGRAALQSWLATPVSPLALEFEAMLRLHLAPLGTKGQLVETLQKVRSDMREMIQFAGGVKQEFLAGTAVTQDQIYLRALGVDFFASIMNTVDEWAERTLAEVDSWDDLTPNGKNERGLEIMKSLPLPLPEDWEGKTAIAPLSQDR